MQVSWWCLGCIIFSPYHPLITAIGAAIGIRLFGLYEFPRHGSFSYLAIGFAVAAVVCLYLVSPTPVGFDYINTLVSQPIVQ